MASTDSLRLLFVAPECAPLAKVGGLADVVAALPKTLRRLGHDARVVIPLYGAIDRDRRGVVAEGSCCVHMGGGVEHWVGVYSAMLDDELPVWLVAYDDYFAREGIYDGDGGGFADNAYRFALLCKAALQLCVDRQFIPHVVHLHDWPAALAAPFLKADWPEFAALRSTASVLTIHNVGYQGKFPADVYGYLGLGAEHFTPDVFEDFGWINLLKAGIHFADAITTVSPTHMWEILGPVGGQGMAPFLSNRYDDLWGILNGADYDHWNPATDRRLPARYRPDDLAGKAVCKAELQRRLGLAVWPEVPLFGMVTRLAPQKGLDLLPGAVPAMLDNMQAQFALLGTGEPAAEDFVRWLGSAYPGRAGCLVGFDVDLSHLVVAGSDFFVMPSLYEPCGLAQLYALKYGTLPVVRATGGLEDTVENYQERDGRGTGFKFYDATPEALYHTIGWANATWWDRPHHIQRLRRQAMAQDYSWEKSAEQYLEVYAAAQRRRAAWE